MSISNNHVILTVRPIGIVTGPINWQTDSWFRIEPIGYQSPSPWPWSKLVSGWVANSGQPVIMPRFIPFLTTNSHRTSADRRRIPNIIDSTIEMIVDSNQLLETIINYSISDYSRAVCSNPGFLYAAWENQVDTTQPQNAAYQHIYQYKTCISHKETMNISARQSRTHEWLHSETKSLH